MHMEVGRLQLIGPIDIDCQVRERLLQRRWRLRRGNGVAAWHDGNRRAVGDCKLQNTIGLGTARVHSDQARAFRNVVGRAVQLGLDVFNASGCPRRRLFGSCDDVVEASRPRTVKHNDALDLAFEHRKQHGDQTVATTEISNDCGARMLASQREELKRFDQLAKAGRSVPAQRARKPINGTSTRKGALVSRLQPPALVHDPGILGIVELLQEAKVGVALQNALVREGVGSAREDASCEHAKLATANGNQPLVHHLLARTSHQQIGKLARMTRLAAPLARYAS